MSCYDMQRKMQYLKPGPKGLTKGLINSVTLGRSHTSGPELIYPQGLGLTWASMVFAVWKSACSLNIQLKEAPG